MDPARARRINCVTFAPDGTVLASLTEGGAVQLWDVQSAKLLTALECGTGKGSLAFSPAGDELASSTRPLKIWDWRTGAVKRTHENQGGMAVAFAPGGNVLAVPGIWQAELIDAATGSLLQKTARTSVAIVLTVSFSPDGKQLASAAMGPKERLNENGGEVSTWDASTGTLLWRNQRDFCVWDVIFSPDGSKVISASDLSVEICDAQSGELVRALRIGDYKNFCVACSPDGETLATGHGDGSVRLWNLESGSPKMTLKGHGDIVYTVAFSPDGKLVASGGADGAARIWDAATGRTVSVLGRARACFIATAACGSPWAMEVMALRRYRDVVLLGSDVGRTVVQIYEHCSPPLARLIASRPVARRLVLSCLVRPLSLLALHHVRGRHGDLPVGTENPVRCAGTQ